MCVIVIVRDGVVVVQYKSQTLNPTWNQEFWIDVST
jgi:hypothetical protein